MVFSHSKMGKHMEDLKMFVILTPAVMLGVSSPVAFRLVAGGIGGVGLPVTCALHCDLLVPVLSAYMLLLCQLPLLS